MSRILSIANLVVFSIIVYMIVNFIVIKDAQPYTGANSKIDTTTLKTQNPKLKINAPIDQNLILKRNIFSLAKVEPVQKVIQPDSQPSKTITKKQIELRLLGTVAGSKEVACAIIEDMKTKVQDIYRIGDVFQGAFIEKIERNRIVLLNDGQEQIINLYVADNDSTNMAKQAGESPTAIAETGVTEKVADNEINKKTFLTKIGGVEAVLKAVKITPHTVDGQTDGLEITGLENLSMAKYLGLENGDIIQTINGQNLTDERKAFQVLQKARALPSMDIQLTRGTQKKTLLFKIE
jgi:general secretion pathway protein C